MSEEQVEEWLKNEYGMTYKELQRCHDFRCDEVLKQDKEIESLQQEIKELNDDIIWWTNRFNAVERDNRELKANLEMYENGVYFSSQVDELQARIDKAIEYMGINEEILKTCEIYDVNGIEVYKILQGSDKE